MVVRRVALEDKGAVMDLQGKVAVVTGASSGIGRETARAFARAGMTTYAVARREDRLKELHEEDPRIVPHPADVTSDEDVELLASRVASERGACHVLVNNAGAHGQATKLATREDEEAFRQTMELNLFGAVRCMRAFADLLRVQTPSRVINVCSIAGQVGVGDPGYSASKFALIGLTESLHTRWSRDGVSVSQVNPGFIRTEGFPQEHMRRTPLDRLVGHPALVADAIVDVARSGQHHRTVPRWYRPIPVLRHAGGRLFWKAAGKVL
jgi:NAD(P)-dependent dehydrogenase (short-subunit alcohol dehydrogenase family)